MGAIFIFKKNRIILTVTVVFASLIAVFFAYINGIVKPIIVKKCKALAIKELESTLSYALNNAVDKGMFLNPIDFIYDENGNISAYSSNTGTVSKLRSYLSNYVLESRKLNRREILDIKLGSLTGIPMLYSMGPKLNIKISSLSYASFDIVSEFSDSGINQTLHRTILNVKGSFIIEEPLDCGEITVESSLVLSETVIVGDVPEAYTVIIRAKEDDEADINDYGANVD